MPGRAGRGTCNQSCFLWGDVWCQGRGSCFTALSCYQRDAGRSSFIAWGDEENLRPLFVCVFRCSDSARPETVRPCLLPCKKDCIVTPFSEWSACPSTCVPGTSSNEFKWTQCTCACHIAGSGLLNQIKLKFLCIRVSDTQFLSPDLLILKSVLQH